MADDSLGPKAKVKEDSEMSKEEKLSRVQEDYETFLETHTFKFPSWLYGPVQGKLLKVEIEDCPNFGDKAFVEFDSARTAIIVVDMQVDFCGKNGYVDVMGYDLSLTAGPIKPIKNILDVVRDGTDIKEIEVEKVREVLLARTSEDFPAADVRVAAHSSIYEKAPLEKYLASTSKKLGVDDRMGIAEALRDVVNADGRVSDREITFFNDIVEALNLTPAQLMGLKAEE